MKMGTITVPAGVAAILANAHEPAPSDDFHTFEGDLIQMAKAATVARQLGFDVGYVGGLPYVQTKAEYDKVVQHIIDHRIEGYWHYT